MPGFSLVREKSGRKLKIPDQGKVREFRNWSGNFGISVQVREKSGNFIWRVLDYNYRTYSTNLK